MTELIATYRLQLRQGVDFDAAAAFLPYLVELGISHLYLSPIFTAAEGSTHGYDVADPAEIDPTLGGRAGFERLAAAARKAGIGLILDLVPNHTVLSVENPWLLDALRHGAESRWAACFDVDWEAGLTLPVLPAPLDTMLAEERLTISPEDGGRMVWEGGWLPLRPGSWTGGADVADVLPRQAWRLRYWERERSAITHRRFFNVTSLIGMRIERPQVFDAMMALPLELVRKGLVAGLRIDHVDGLVDPAGFLHRVRREVGPDVPVWIEKILTGDEALPPAWPVEGTTGYEAGRRIAQLLTDADGLERLDGIWRARTGYEASYRATCAAARAQVISEDLGAELHELIDLADAALAADMLDPPGPEGLREALVALLIAFPRYRSYVTAFPAEGEDRAVLEATVEAAAAGLRSRSSLDPLAALLLDGSGPAAGALRDRFQQVTGALTAKSQEDCAFYRYTRFLAACEVGAEPDDPVLETEGFAAWLASPQVRPMGLVLTSSHDTKRAEDARMRLVAISHRPELFRALVAATEDAAGEPAADAATLWYVTQSVLAFWEERDDLEERIDIHMRKALREARLVTSWPYPVPAAEDPVVAMAQRIVAAWRKALPEPAAEFIALGETLSLVQLALKVMLPGVPDIYQASETGAFDLVDPDNRRPPDLARLRAPSEFGARKAALLRALLAERRQDPAFFRDAAATVSEAGGVVTLTRDDGRTQAELRFRRDGGLLPEGGPVAWTNRVEGE